MENKELKRNAFGHSKKGSILCYVEYIIWFVLIINLAISVALMGIPQNPHLPFPVTYLRVLLTIMGIFAGVFLGSQKRSFIVVWLFPPTAEEIEAYKIFHKEEVEKKIQEKEEEIKELRKEI